MRFFSASQKNKLSAFRKENFPTVFELFCYLHDEGGTKKNLSQCGEYEVIFAVSILFVKYINGRSDMLVFNNLLYDAINVIILI